MYIVTWIQYDGDRHKTFENKDEAYEYFGHLKTFLRHVKVYKAEVIEDYSDTEGLKC